MTTLRFSARAPAVAPIRLIMLPGAYAGPQDFVDAGFAEAVRQRKLNIDLVFAGLELQHVNDRGRVVRLHEEEILPARRLGCAVWLGGISLGGYLALNYAERYPATLAGLSLFAPYLGSHIVTAEIARAGGLSAWQPHALAEEDDERRAWRFIKALGPTDLPVYLGLGREDRFGERHRLMAAALPAHCVDVVPGGHDWPTWLRLWESFLDVRFKSEAAPR